MTPSIVELCGWVGSALLAFCGLPQAVESWRTGRSDGVTWGLLVMWGLGEFMTLAYVLPRMELPLIMNYTANIVFLSVIIFYKVRPRSKA
jgi:uncharacterized protein with PQ loop repeat